MEKILEVKNIEKYYGNKSNLTKAIDNINFDVNKGEFVGIMGASGSGKTTLLNCISTIDRVTAGHIIISGIYIFMNIPTLYAIKNISIVIIPNSNNKIVIAFSLKNNLKSI